MKTLTQSSRLCSPVAESIALLRNLELSPGSSLRDLMHRLWASSGENLRDKINTTWTGPKWKMLNHEIARLLLQCLARLGQKPRIFHCDYRLRREAFE
jgi:hypothetical protein